LWRSIHKDARVKEHLESDRALDVSNKKEVILKRTVLLEVAALIVILLGESDMIESAGNP
jgi:hypothetical protein